LSAAVEVERSDLTKLADAGDDELFRWRNTTRREGLGKEVAQAQGALDTGTTPDMPTLKKPREDDR